ncbi:2-hydroxycarboxylate transporter family protein [Bradyrhizobium sp. CB1015]|uniref:2-hydroxycarboxylate transporter family protein n=1 Tax=Bradyrhizobium sp. CB1015 TaxID=2976822 RepID=UPI0021AA2899|nr:2-hydroxycarboxylate transporter family protein [Bradyrhizobium sp. CB1015]UWU88909.1 2-hydroxycarboxylate transporter family protein [Bradyrhizobium sp. CB1015]
MTGARESSSRACSSEPAACRDVPPECLCGLGQAKFRPEHVDRNGHVPFRPARGGHLARGELIADQGLMAFAQIATRVGGAIMIVIAILLMKSLS